MERHPPVNDKNLPTPTPEDEPDTISSQLRDTMVFIDADDYRQYQQMVDVVYDPDNRPASDKTYSSEHFDATKRFLKDIGSLKLGMRAVRDPLVMSNVFRATATFSPREMPLASGQLSLSAAAHDQFGDPNSKRIQRRLKRLVAGKALGTLSLSEVEVGSDASKIRTEAIIEVELDEEGKVIEQSITLRTPDSGADKFWVNVADPISTYMVTAARIIVNGEDQGVGLISVPLHTREEPRDISIRRMSEKTAAYMAHARITFGKTDKKGENRGVKLPFDSWLSGPDAGIDENGNYFNAEPSHNKRYHKAISVLGLGRIGLSAAAVASTHASLKLLATYAAQRKTGGNKTMEEQDSWQEKMVSYTTEAFALAALSNAVRRDFASPHTDPSMNNLKASVAKSYITTNALKISTWAQKRLGARGYFKENIIPLLIENENGAYTAEGEALAVADTMGRALTKMHHAGLPPLTATKQPMSEYSRWGSLVATRAATLPERQDVDTIGEGGDAVHLTTATAEHLALNEMIVATNKMSGEAHEVSQAMTDLYAIDRVLDHSAWHARHGQLDAEGFEELAAARRQRVSQILPQLPQLIDAFSIPDNLFNAGIANPQNYDSSPMTVPSKGLVVQRFISRLTRS